MFKKEILSILTVATLVLAASGVQAGVALVNGDFETMIGDTGPVTISSGDWTSHVGADMTTGGTWSDGSETADMVGWVGNANISVVANQGPITGSASIAMNASGWGNPGGATSPTTVLSDSIGAADGTPLDISLWATSGGNFPVVFDLLADGVALTPTSSTDPAMGAGLVEFTRSYGAATMAAASGQDLTVQFGLGLTPDMGGQAKFDDVSVAEVPEPASLALLGMGGLLMLRRRRA